MPSQLTLRVMADYGASGIWVDGEIGPFRHGMLELADLDLPADLAASFNAWIATYWERRQWSETDAESFNQTGRALAVRLKAFLGSRAAVSFQPESWPTGLGPEEFLP